MTDSKTPDWAKGAADDALIKWLRDPRCSISVRFGMSGNTQNAAADAISQALAAVDQRAYARGIEEAAKVIEKETEAPAQRNSKSMWVQDIGDRLATAIRQLLEVKG